MEWSDYEDYNLTYIADDVPIENDHENEIIQKPKFVLPMININNVENELNDNSSPLIIKDHSLSEKSKFILSTWFFNHQHYPYMNKATKKKFASELNITILSISNFLNKLRSDWI